MGNHIHAEGKDFRRSIVERDFTIPNNVINAYELAYELMPR